MIRTINDIRKLHDERRKHHHQIYKTILREVYKLIESKDAIGKLNTFYRVPCVVYGNTSYSVSTAVLYIIRKLSEGGFVVFPHDGNLLYIDWSIVEQKMPSEPVKNQQQQLTLKSCLKKNS